MMEYPAWKKKPHTPAYINFLRSYKLEPHADEQETGRNVRNLVFSLFFIAFLMNPSIFQANQLNVTPQEAEIKIPSVGATPVAVSTQLPAAVAQLNNQGIVIIHFHAVFVVQSQ
jgi:E1A-binding protein p400